MGSIAASLRSIKNVAIIGAGPSGITAAKYLLAERHFEKIVIFEQRSRVGGLWNHVPCDSQSKQDLKIPSTDPNAGIDTPIGHSKDATFMSPVYDRLETNIPRGLMGFSELDWPQNSQLFPQHSLVLQYIEDYSRDVSHLIQFKTQVLDVRRSSEGWQIKTRTLESVNEEMETFDAVIVANGHFNIPFIPSVHGIEAWQHTYPASITHSKFFRKPEDYAGKKVIVVGNSASGVDIGAQIRQTCAKPLIQSSTSESFLQPDRSDDQIEKPEIVKYDAESRTIHFCDGSVESDVDVILYCTGYLYSFPFLESLKPAVVSSGERVQHLYKHIFYQPDPTLSFLVLNQKVTPFPVAEAQSAVIARVLAGRLTLPSSSEMKHWEQDLLQQATRLRDFHVLKFPQDADYINELHSWAMSATGHCTGKEPPYWTDIDYWTRERFPAIKKAFQGFGEARHDKMTLADVGFHYEESVS